MCDLNGDGTVDLIDLQMLATTLADPTPVLSTIYTKIPESLTVPVREEGTQIAAGSLEGLVDGSAAVTLQPASEAPISEENPVASALTLPSPRPPVAMGGLVLQTPAGTTGAVTGGTLVVIDEDGGGAYL